MNSIICSVKLFQFNFFFSFLISSIFLFEFDLIASKILLLMDLVLASQIKELFSFKVSLIPPAAVVIIIFSKYIAEKTFSCLLVSNLINSLNLENWIFLYIFFELNLIKELGYDTNLGQNKFKNININDSIKIKIDNYIYDVPNFLILKKIPDKFSNILIKKSLNFTRYFLQNKFFIPNNILFPKSRVILENYFN